MWCVPKLDDEYITRMEHLLDLYARPYNKEEPVICIDEKSKHLLQNVRREFPATENDLIKRVARYQDARNAQRATINWTFTKTDAREKLKNEVGD